ncbi:unnamed protein product [Mytilus edulis]|uniref:Uncharacterized protein n=1 Tax=Mytilus edulis TaxID=6550 RepID=A0A8S3RCC4_MYTED|nr:unnamed protein product [Mytilus edulis]
MTWDSDRHQGPWGRKEERPAGQEEKVQHEEIAQKKDGAGRRRPAKKTKEVGHVVAEVPEETTDISSGNESEEDARAFPSLRHEIANNSIDFTPSQESSVHDTVGEHVSFKIKEKIWEGKFIELHSLLRTQKEMEEVDEGDLKLKRGKICIEKRSSGVYLSINEWTSAFMIFMSVYIEKYSTRAQELLKYMRDIRLAATRSENWATYDEQFRLKIEKNPNLSWGNIHGEYWLLHITSPTVHNSVSVQSQGYRTNTQNRGNYNSNAATLSNNRTHQQSQVTSGSVNMSCKYYNNGNDCPYFPRWSFGGTISSYISGVSYHHKIQGIQDTTKFFIIGKALEGIKRIQGGKRNDIRAPITVKLLSDMISCLDKVCKNKYEAALFSAVFSVAFFGLLRVGEITTSKSKSVINGSNLTISDILVRRKVLS